MLARVQVAGQAAPQAAVRLRPILDEIALSLHPARGIEVVVDCPARLAARGSRDLIAQALANLGANAAKHTRRGSIRISARRQSGRVAIEVADTGAGLPSGAEERVFERFFRGGARNGEGFGLGLAIVREAVAAMDGTVGLHSPPEGGTVATIGLPAA